MPSQFAPGQPADPGQIRLFRWADDLPAVLWDDVAARPADQAAAAVGARQVEHGFLAPVVGLNYLVDMDIRRVLCADQPDERPDYQTGLVLLTALAKALDAPQAGEMATFGEMPGGDLFFTGPHALRTGPLLKRYGKDPQALVQRALAMGGHEIEGGDAGVMLPGLPKVDLYVLLWAGDEEFPARVVMGLDRRAHMHLALDGLWALANILVTRLAKD